MDWMSYMLSNYTVGGRRAGLNIIFAIQLHRCAQFREMDSIFAIHFAYPEACSRMLG